MTSPSNLLALLFLASGCAASESLVADDGTAATTERSSDPTAPPSAYVLSWLRAREQELTGDLERLRHALLSRAREEAPELVERLHTKTTAPRPRGYGVVPERVADEPARTPRPRETRYSLEEISWAYSLAFRDAAVLAARAEDDPELDLAFATAEHARIAVRQRSLRDHLAYQEFWQPRTLVDAEAFAQRNEQIERVRAWIAARDAGEAARAQELEDALRRELAPFRSTAGLAIERDASGQRVLALELTTDVADRAFLTAFDEAVELHWNGAEAMRAAGLRLELRWKVVATAELYPEGAPARESLLDLDRHVERFPPDALVVTTGAASLHSLVGRSIRLGPAPVAPRVLAHELGHLLGFQDAYLRGFEGDPHGPFGAVLVEWTGLLDDLMGGPAIGAVTPAMVARLEEAYGG